MKFFAGLDLGQRNDYSALIIAGLGASGVYTVTFAKRWRGVSYTDLVERISHIVGDPLFEESIHLRFDQTGVGVAAADLLREARADGRLKVRELTPITFSGGNVPNPKENTWPKRDLLERLRILLEQKRLVIAKRLPLANTIEREIKAFGYAISASGRDTYGGHKSHDDLVTALALCCHEERGPIVLSAFDYLPESAIRVHDPFSTEPPNPNPFFYMPMEPD